MKRLFKGEAYRLTGYGISISNLRRLRANFLQGSKGSGTWDIDVGGL
ncbi:MAG: hypothetical protein LBJ00_12425 [Planctomycetaceae bacterium]|nr:hypothetical protein [Planctomycetaceae bacterium]